MSQVLQGNDSSEYVSDAYSAPREAVMQPRLDFNAKTDSYPSTSETCGKPEMDRPPHDHPGDLVADEGDAASSAAQSMQTNADSDDNYFTQTETGVKPAVQPDINQGNCENGQAEVHVAAEPPAEELDHDMEELKEMDFEDLQAEPFMGPTLEQGGKRTYSPKRRRSDPASLRTSLAQVHALAATAIQSQDPGIQEGEESGQARQSRLEQAQHAQQSAQESQLDLLRDFSLDEWTEAGQWFQAQFGVFATDLASIRKRKRDLTAKYEKMIAERSRLVAEHCDVVEQERLRWVAGGAQVFTPKKAGSRP